MLANKTLSIDPSWYPMLTKEFESIYFQNIQQKLTVECSLFEIFPPEHSIFNAFNLVSFNQVKVIILGQDPYHGSGQANGLAFSVAGDQKVPPSLKNIFKELISDINLRPSESGDLGAWASSGVLLLNSVLTVRAKTPGSHQNIGWQEFTDNIIKELSKSKKHLVFILWGKYAQSKKSIIDDTKHLILEAPHPSPFSAYKGFFGSKPFSKTNDYLKSNGIKPVNWALK